MAEITTPIVSKQSTSAWFSSSVDRTYIDLWIRQGGSVEDTYKADLLPEYLFSCDLEEHDTQRIINHISYMVIHPDWIFDAISEKKLKPIDQYILENYNFPDDNVDKIASVVHKTDKKANKINFNGNTDILSDLANHNQSNDNYIVAHSPTIPDKKYLLPRKRARKVSKGKDPAQGNNVQQSTTTDIMSDDASRDLLTDNMQTDIGSSDLQSDIQAVGNGRSTINKDLGCDPIRDRPRTLPDFMSKKRPKVALTSTSEDDSFFSDEDSSKKRKRTNYTQKSVRASSTGKKAPSIRCECGRSVQPTLSANQLLPKEPKVPLQNVNKETRSIASIRLQHISIRNLLEKVFKYLQVVRGSNSSLMDDVYEFTPGQNGFSARLKSTANSRATNANSRQTRGKSSFRKT